VTARSRAELSTEVEPGALSGEHSALLEQQAATNQVIQAIGRSGFELQPIFETVAEHAVRLCRADAAQIFIHDKDHYRLATASGGSDEYRSLIAARAISPGQGTLVGRVGLDRRSVLVADILADPAYEWSEAQRLGGFRSIVAIPMLSDDEVIGVISLWRREVDPFTPREIEVATTFAAQGAVAIRNANLMQQLELRTQQLAQSVEELEGLREVGEAVNSTLDLREVLSTIVMHAVQLSGTEGGSIFEFREEDQSFRIRAAFGTSAELLDALRATRVGLDDTLVGRAASTRASIAVTDIDEAPGDAHLAQLSRAGWRSMLAVPLVREDTILGALVVRRRTVGAFSPKVIELVETFASQSALAIQNARLFQQLELASRQLTQWNQELEQRVESQVEQIERIGRLKRFLSPAVADLVVSGGDESFLESHRREITVVFCDLRGFTSFAETVEPEDTMSVLREYHAALGELVFHYEGTLERFTGDGLMVFFNDPVACADGPARAVRMAVEMRSRIGDIARGWRRQGHVLGFGVGIAQGYATLGRVGFEGRYDYAAIGTVTNLAARLCEAASDGQILVTERVLAGVERFVGVEEMEEMTPKGFSRPVIPHNVLSIDESAG
jgi:class 3 adenylate cyclase/putative methionine-R-sulfoxide reductase with GAF domain